MGHIEVQTVPIKFGDMCAPFSSILGKQVLVLQEDWNGIPNGSVLVRNRSTGIYLIYEGGLFEAIRGMGHAKAGYGFDPEAAGGEIDRLYELRADLLQMLLPMIWDYQNLGARKRNRLAQEATRAMAKLHLVRDERKAAACHDLHGTEDPFDSLRRFNPGAHSMKVTAAAYQLSERIETAQWIAEFVDARHLAMLQELSRIYGEIAKVHRILREFDDIDTTQYSRPIYSHWRQIRDASMILQQVDVRPFTRGFLRAREDLTLALESAKLDAGQEILARRYIDRAARSLVMYQDRRELERILWPLSRELKRRLPDRNPNRMRFFAEELARFALYWRDCEQYYKRLRGHTWRWVNRDLSGVAYHLERGDWTRVYEYAVRATGKI